MKNGKKIFILVETFLGLMVFVLVMFMFLEKNEKKQEKISVIIQNVRFHTEPPHADYLSKNIPRLPMERKQKRC